jgi:hypothetical protein
VGLELVIDAWFPHFLGQLIHGWGVTLSKTQLMTTTRGASPVLLNFISVLDVEEYCLRADIEFEKISGQSCHEPFRSSTWENEHLRKQTSNLPVSCEEGKL